MLAIVDCNFPAVEVATQTTSGKCVVLAGVDLPRAISAIASVLPIDMFVADPVYHMEPDEHLAMPPLGTEVIDQSKQALAVHSKCSVKPLHRSVFYGEARKAFAVVQTMERRPYGNFLIKKGVVGPDGNDLVP